LTAGKNTEIEIAENDWDHINLFLGQQPLNQSNNGKKTSTAILVKQVLASHSAIAGYHPYGKNTAGVREVQAKSASGVRQECVRIGSELFHVNNSTRQQPIPNSPSVIRQGA
jgi:hypothetical protein